MDVIWQCSMVCLNLHLLNWMVLSTFVSLHLSSSDFTQVFRRPPALLKWTAISAVDDGGRGVCIHQIYQTSCRRATLSYEGLGLSVKLCSLGHVLTKEVALTGYALAPVLQSSLQQLQWSFDGSQSWRSDPFSSLLAGFSPHSQPFIALYSRAYSLLQYWLHVYDFRTSNRGLQLWITSRNRQCRICI